MRIISVFDGLCTFPEDFIISFLDIIYLYEINNKNIKNMENPVREVVK
jgi:hypothetical protein